MSNLTSHRPLPPAPHIAPRDLSCLPLYAAWLRWAEQVFVQNRLPFSGDVHQWISAWGQAVGQVGWFNFNIVGASDAELEQRIGSRYSYGRQLGRMLDVLRPLVEENRPRLAQQDGGERALKDFFEMDDEIGRLKAQRRAELRR